MNVGKEERTVFHSTAAIVTAVGLLIGGSPAELGHGLVKVLQLAPEVLFKVLHGPLGRRSRHRV